MGKALVIASAAFIALGTYYGASRTVLGLETTRHIANSQYEAVTRLAAMAGLNVARQALAETWREREFRGVHHEAGYRTTVDISGRRADVVSTGSMPDADGGTAEYLLHARIEKKRVSASGTPLWMQYAIASDENLTLRGDIEVSSEDGDHNANVHTNGTLEVSGNSVDVQGFGSYANGYDGKNSHVDNAFDPNSNPDGAPVHAASEEIEIPEFDIEDYVDRRRPDGSTFVDRTTRDDVDLAGELDLGGTWDDPFVWYVEGDLRVTGNTVINGYTVFLVKGDMEIDRSLEAGDTGRDASESSIALYGDGDLSIKGDRTLETQVFVRGNATTLHGTPTIRGTLVSNGKVELKGTPDIVYRPAAASLAYLWGRTFETLVVTSYYEH